MCQALILDIDNSAVNKRNKVLILMEFMFPVVKQKINEQRL